MDSDLDSSGLVSQSDNEAHSSETDSLTYKKFAMEREASSHSRDTSSDPLSRNLINQQILHQLTGLSEHLDSNETASVKKTNDQSKVKKNVSKKQKLVPKQQKLVNLHKSAIPPQLINYLILLP